VNTRAVTVLLATAGLAAAGSGCHSAGSGAAATRSAPTAPASAAGKPRVALALVGGSRPMRLTACALTGEYRSFGLGGFVPYRGRVTPSPAGSWSVKVKLKRCIPHGFSETFFEIVRGRRDGSFSGIVPKLNPNEFYIRADYSGPTGTVGSPNVFFRTTGRG
jgi:hypothetical protein